MGGINEMDDSTKKNTGFILTIVGMIVMLLFTLTKIVPTTSLAGYSVLVGIAFFFIVQAVDKTPNIESGLQFKSFFKDLKKTGVLPLALLPILTAIATLLVGDLIFDGGFSAHIIGRTESMLSFDKLKPLIFTVIVAALGEEIAWRGFFVGKSMRFMPFWISALISSVLFAGGHIATGNFMLVAYDIFTIFIDSLIYALIYKKSGNCLISTFSHILCNATGIIVTILLI